MADSSQVQQPPMGTNTNPIFYAWLVELVRIINMLAVNAVGFITNVTGTLPIVITPSGTDRIVSVNNATSSTVGVVKPDNSTITISAGVISAVSMSVAIPGPYADDAAAALAGVALHFPYYVGSGFVRVRIV